MVDQKKKERYLKLRKKQTSSTVGKVVSQKITLIRESGDKEVLVFNNLIRK